MELKDLIGLHLLSGYDTKIEKPEDEYYSNYTVVLFILDGVTYRAEEDPSDDYRSFLKNIEVTSEKVNNTFIPHQVFGKMKDDSDYYKNDIIQFIDVITNEIVLELGTQDYDDYYPVCIMYWNPIGLASNN